MFKFLSGFSKQVHKTFFQDHDGYAEERIYHAFQQHLNCWRQAATFKTQNCVELFQGQYRTSNEDMQ